MAKAIGETERRREKQQRYNEEHGIVPQGSIRKWWISCSWARAWRKPKPKGRGKAKAVEPAGLSAVDMTPKALQQKIRELEGQMMQHAQNSEFEEAAQIRDQLHQLRELFIAASLILGADWRSGRAGYSEGALLLSPRLPDNKHLRRKKAALRPS